MKIILSALLCLFLPIQGRAHPHIWVSTTLELLVEKSHITGLNVHWEFDALYSTSFLTEADSNKNKELDATETQETIQAVFIEGQTDLYPFMHVAPNSQKTPFKVIKPKIWLEDESLNYTFNIMLETPQPLQGTHEFAIYDPEFYVAFEQDLDMKLPAGITCQQTLEENENISLYFDTVNPETYTLTCT